MDLNRHDFLSLLLFKYVDRSLLTKHRDERIIIIEGGALWGNVYRALIDEGEGLMVNGGRCPSVGVSGFILGGGIGPFSRSYGMGVDDLEEISIVTADGELYVVRVDDEPESEEGKHRKTISSYPKNQASGLLCDEHRLGCLYP